MNSTYFRYIVVQYYSILTKVKAITTKTSAIFLLVVLVTGTFAAVYPSLFIIEDVQAQTAEPEYEYGYDKYRYDYNDDNNYNSAEYYPPGYESNDGYMQKDHYPDNLFWWCLEMLKVLINTFQNLNK